MPHRNKQGKIQESEGFMELLINSVPAMIFYLDAEQRYTIYNETFMQWYNVDAKEAIGIPVAEFIGEVAYARIAPNLAKAYAGEQVRFEMPAPTRINPHKWLSIVYTPDKRSDGNVTGIIVHATDITESKRTEIALRESEARFRTVFEQAPLGIALMEGREMIITLGNNRIFEIWGKPSTVTGLPVIKALPELEGQPFMKLMEGVYDTGIPHIGTGTLAKLVRNGVLEDAYFDFVYAPVRNAEGKVTGIMTLATEVTHRELANQAIARSEARFRALIEEAPVATCLFTGREMTIPLANDKMLRVWGKDRSVIGKRLEDAVPELKGQPFLDILDEVYTTGKPYSATAAPAQLEVDGVLGTYYFNFTYKPLFNEAGEVYGIIDMAIDVTEQVLAHGALEEKEAVLRNAIELAELGTWNVDIVAGKITYSERMQQWLGIEEATIPTGASPRIHPDDGERIRKAFAKALDKDGTGRFDEVYKINNVVTGVTRIIHASGVTQFDEQGNPVRLSGTAQDVTIQQDLQAKLEQEVQLRTEELGSAIEELQATNEELADANDQLLRSNEELAQYAYVASHDLQEPLRKIQVYASMLTAKKEMPQSSLDLASKIAASSERMRQLILGLLDFSRLLKSDTIYQPVDLNKVVKEVLHDFELVANEKNATFNVDKLPSIEAVGLQMNQLFYNLISNSLKFTKPDVPPVITITADAVTEELLREHVRTPLPFASYYRICISDNGIGFEKQYFDQIFEIFKRLHGRETYPGSGIGLALCRRIISNHAGALYTESTPGEGATFCLILPDKQSGL
ncbi:MAG: PAS domain-containing protein [Niastella sp.]|nr:PAS domain-containing protein [Niastella sp.]